jgi:type I restriction enzyme S subunit
MSSKAKTTAAKESGKSALVPKLRFPEFWGGDGWKATPLGELGAIVTGKTPSTKEDDLWGGEILFITPTDITEGEKHQHTTQRTVVETTGTKVLPPSSVVYTCIASIGKMALTVVPSVTNQQINAVVPNGKTAREFIYYSLAKLTPWIKSIPATSTLPIINKTQFSGFIIPHPEDKAEQQKIAECLSSVDEVIIAQARKLDALKTHKKGLMQQLFPREGETQPRLRFPEFQNAGEWEEVALGDIAEIKLGKMLDKQKHTTGRLLPYLNNLSVRWNEVNTSNLPEMYFNDGELGRFGLKAGDVVVCEGGEPGRAAVWDGRLPDLKFQKAIHRVRFSVPFEPRLLVLHLENLAGTTQLEMLFTGGGIKHLTRETFAQLKIPLIPHAEQQRIAACLSSLDDLITAETQKLEALKTHKRGLMQQLFPSPEEAEA